ncbi:hypothetical protein CRYUN_Cryun19dG0112700 [Craigia yunnanensis]
MAAKPLTTEAIAITEKKMDMTLDDIIKMSKNISNKAKKQLWVPNTNQKPVSNAAKEKALNVRQYMHSKSSLRQEVRQYMHSKSSLRQGVLAQRRSNFQGNRLPLAAEAVRRAAVAPFRIRAFNGSRVANLNKPRIGVPPVQRRAANGGFAAKPQQQQQQQQDQQGNVVTKQRPQTLDSLFANMKEQRMKVLSRNAVQHNGDGRQRMPWGRGRFGN